MRPLHLADIETAARVLMRVAPDARGEVMSELIARTNKADRFRQTHGRPHPKWGQGTLLSCAAREPMAPRPPLLDADALHAYATVIEGLLTDTPHQSV